MAASHSQNDKLLENWDKKEHRRVSINKADVMIHGLSLYQVLVCIDDLFPTAFPRPFVRKAHNVDRREKFEMRSRLKDENSQNELKITSYNIEDQSGHSLGT